MNQLRMIAFASKLGWIALVHRDRTICEIQIGFSNRQESVIALKKNVADKNNGLVICEHDEMETNWIRRFQRYANGERVSISNLKIDQSWMTPFQKRVTAACRRIPRGQVLTYGQLATMAGSPGASRAVGTVMAQNRFPLVIPCHRVVASNGLGGFSAAGGQGLKQKLLSLEGVQLHC